MSVEEINQFWNNARLLLISNQNDFSFINAVVTPAFRSLVVCILKFSLVQQNFPDLPQLNPHIREKGFKPWQLTSLKGKGLIDSVVPGKKEGLWRLTAKSLTGLLEIPSDLIPAEATASTRNTKKSEKSKGKYAMVLKLLKNEKVGDRLLVTNEMAEKVATEAGLRTNDFFAAISRFEKKGWLKRERQGENTMLIFSKEVSIVKSAAVNSNVLLQRIEAEIARVTESIAKMQKELSNKKATREEILRLLSTT